MGGLGPSISLVTVMFSNLESSTSHMTVFIMFDDASNYSSAVDGNKFYYGKFSFSASSLVALVTTFTNVKSRDAYKSTPLKCGMLVVFTIVT